MSPATGRRAHPWLERLERAAQKEGMPMRFENIENYAHPLVVDMEPGTYSWCSCGRSKEAPFCDGSHEGTGLEPIEFTIDTPRRVALCDCGLTQTPPFCDNTHATLEEEE